MKKFIFFNLFLLSVFTNAQINQVDANGKEVLIPFVKDLIQEVKRNERQLIVKAPEGLIAIYLA